ncbi:tRNA(Met) cytidine acetyltransferase TmcA [Zooshikella harenae]|uniref:tRNA(Met) cytidine acetyltransferase TmcA n=1 Tax=Zooshikella harenae TaxID=2827238 RepID=A0ABS5Z8P7_9GAMM|nr:GNAT family N-acetyltransferase [Zooshikella harenae]MBU2710409.1 tRNA(Met) cytidine acetyltransferase [Zooshikella harenae]
MVDRDISTADITLIDVLNSACKQASETKHRALVVVSGSHEWAGQQQQNLISYLSTRQQTKTSSYPFLWLADAGLDSRAIKPRQINQWLGREVQFVVMDSFVGFHPDSFGAATGLIPAGGALVWIIPALASWPAYEDPEYLHFIPQGQDPRRLFLQRLRDCLHGVSNHWLFTAKGLIHQPSVLSGNESGLRSFYSQTYANAEQQCVVQEVIGLVNKHKAQPIVLTADRGRGKSAALGLAVGLLLEQSPATNKDPLSLLATAPRKQALAKLWQHASEVLQNDQQHQSEGVDLGTVGQRLMGPSGQLGFSSPQDILQERPEVDLLLIDEAAMIPVPILTKLVMAYPKCVLASTVHGYEGTGRGFAVRFQRFLQQHFPRFQQLTLEEPVRWAVGDPLEAFSYQALLLGANPAEVKPTKHFQLEQLTLTWLDAKDLIANEHRLNQLFALLVLAHYQTKPSDLRQLLDDPSGRLLVAEWQGQVVGTLWAVAEPPLPEALREPVWLGQRRLKGQLLPQTLTYHGGDKLAGCFAYLRVMRIAVHPDWQRIGVGQQLVKKTYLYAQQAQFDFLGTSFGLTGDVLAFWLRCGLSPVRWGLSSDAASGVFSAVMLRPLNDQAKSSCLSWQQEHVLSLRYWLTAQHVAFHTVGCEVILPWVSACWTQGLSNHITTRDWQLIAGFIQGQRGLQLTLPAIANALAYWLANTQSYQQLTPHYWEALIRLAWLQETERQVACKLKFNGQKSLCAELRQVMQNLVFQ